MFCPNCGRPCASDANFCSSCGAVTMRQVTHARIRIVRPRFPRAIAGVCAGIAIYYGWDLTLLRVLTVVSVFLTGGFTILLYLVAWLLLPDAQYALPVGMPSPANPV